MKVTVLVKHYQRSDLTDACVESIRRSTPEPHRLMVIDGSADEQPWKSSHPEVRVVPVLSDLGLIASFNPFIDGSADLWLCLNNDVIVSRRWMEGILVALACSPEVGIIAPLYDDPGGAWLYFPPPPYPVRSEEWQAHLDAALPPPGVLQFVKHVDNCAWGFTQRLVDAVGLPDERFTGAGWGANLDYCYRARRAGFLVAVSRGSFVHHAKAATYGADLEYRRKAEEARDRVLREKYGDPAVVW